MCPQILFAIIASILGFLLSVFEELTIFATVRTTACLHALWPQLSCKTPPPLLVQVRMAQTGDAFISAAHDAVRPWLTICLCKEAIPVTKYRR